MRAALSKKHLCSLRTQPMNWTNQNLIARKKVHLACCACYHSTTMLWIESKPKQPKKSLVYFSFSFAFSLWAFAYLLKMFALSYTYRAIFDQFAGYEFTHSLLSFCISSGSLWQTPPIWLSAERELYWLREKKSAK